MPSEPVHPRRPCPEGQRTLELRQWRCAGCAPGARPAEFFAADVPGTAASALRAAGRDEPEDLDALDWWWTMPIRGLPDPAGRLVLCLDGIATRGEVRLDGDVLLGFDSMWAAHAIDVTAALADGAEHELAIRCAALGPLVAAPRKPRARWRTRLVAQGLRFERTMLLGRAPGMAPRPAAVGPWRPVRLEERVGPELVGVDLRTQVEGTTGRLTVMTHWRGGAAPGAAVVQLTACSPAARQSGRPHARAGADADTADRLAAGARSALGGADPACAAPLGVDGRVVLDVEDVARWWPHTHGTPVLYLVSLVAGESRWELGRVGFRELAAPGDLDDDGLALEMNGRRVFVRGVVWMPADPVGLAPSAAELRATLSTLRDAGVNLVRVVGTAHYESPAFHALCDELGLLVWQDAMFANLDVPLGDEAFRARVEDELATLVAAVAGHPSTVVLCGGSEVDQQVAMLGLDPDALLAGGVGDELLPAAARAGASDAVLVPNAPCGRDGRVLKADAGVANWFAVGGYRRPLGDARRAGVRFASECLAFANLPDGDGWDQGVPADAGVDWTFADVRDHYLAARYGVDPAALRADDVDRYAALSRQLTGEVMAEVFGEWRRPGSPTAGAIVLCARDLVPGSGWGLLDASGEPKAALGRLRAVLAPTAVWTTDEGTDGIAVHVAADAPSGFAGRLTVALHRDFRDVVLTGTVALALAPGEALTLDAERVLGRFADAAYAYRFGPPAHDAIVATLEDAIGTLVAQAVRFPMGPPLAQLDAEALGVRLSRDGPRVLVSATSGLWGVRVGAPGRRPDLDAFDVGPGSTREVLLHARGGGAGPAPVTLTALNLAEPLLVAP